MHPVHSFAVQKDSPGWIWFSIQPDAAVRFIVGCLDNRFVDVSTGMRIQALTSAFWHFKAAKSGCHIGSDASESDFQINSALHFLQIVNLFSALLTASPHHPPKPDIQSRSKSTEDAACPAGSAVSLVRFLVPKFSFQRFIFADQSSTSTFRYSFSYHGYRHVQFRH